jgi:hypothetical protein
MKDKFDLIVEYLEGIKDSVYRYGNLTDVKRLNNALVAARELRALEPVGVFKKNEAEVWEEVWPEFGGTKFYAFDKVAQ